MLVAALVFGWTLAAAPRAPAQQQAPPDESGMTPALVAELVRQAPVFAAGGRSALEVGHLHLIPDTQARYVEIRWEEGGRQRSAIVTVAPVSAAPDASYLSRAGRFGLHDIIEDVRADDVVAALETAFLRNLQRGTMARMQQIAVANDALKLEIGRYARSLSHLALHAPGLPATDMWRQPWRYVSTGDSYTLVSYGFRGKPGPEPPADWADDAFECDLVMTDGDFVEAPAPPAGLAADQRLLQRIADPWRKTTGSDADLQASTISTMRSISSANVMASVKTGAYAATLAELRRGGYVTFDVDKDAWGRPFVYAVDGDHYTVTSHGCDGKPGPPPPKQWTGLPCEPDIVMRDGRFVQAPVRRRRH